MSSIGRYTGRATGGNPGFSSSVKNGRIPKSLLGHLETQPVTPSFPASEHYLAKDAAVGFDAMVRAAEADGVKIRLLEAYRTYARQEYFWGEYVAGRGNLAAKPGTSNHGWGTAVDVNRGADTKALPWMRINAHRFGWDLPDQLGKKEPWHWEFIRDFDVSHFPDPEPEIPVYAHGELVPGAFYDSQGGVTLVFLRPVAEAFDFEVEAKRGVATLDNEKGRVVKVKYQTTPDGRGVIAVRELGKALGATVVWDGEAVRIG